LITGCSLYGKLLATLDCDSHDFKKCLIVHKKYLPAFSVLAFFTTLVLVPRFQRPRGNIVLVFVAANNDNKNPDYLHRGISTNVLRKLVIFQQYVLLSTKRYSNKMQILIKS